MRCHPDRCQAETPRQHDDYLHYYTRKPTPFVAQPFYALQKTVEDSFSASQVSGPFGQICHRNWFVFSDEFNCIMVTLSWAADRRRPGTPGAFFSMYGFQLAHFVCYTGPRDVAPFSGRRACSRFTLFPGTILGISCDSSCLSAL